MKRFAFRLERLLGVRRLEERERARVVADLLAEEAIHQQRVQQSEERRDAAQRQIAAIRSEIKSAGIQLAADSLFRAMRQDVRREQQAMHAASTQTDEARQAYVAARQKTKALERLRERREKHWHRDTERLLARSDDETAALMRRRRGTP